MHCRCFRRLPQNHWEQWEHREQPRIARVSVFPLRIPPLGTRGTKPETLWPIRRDVPTRSQLVPATWERIIRCLCGCSRCSRCSHANCRGLKKPVKPPASRSRSGIMHRLMAEFDRRLPRPRRSPFGCDGLMVCSPRPGDHLFVSLMGSYIWHHAALDQFRALYGVAMERGGVRRPLSHHR